MRAGASYNAACAYAKKEDADSAFEWLGKAVEAGFANLGTMMTDPDLAGIRNDPRFAAFLPTGKPATFLEGFEVLYAIDGEAQGDRYGWIGRNAGDVDGDEVADLLISAPFKNLGGGGEGRIYVHSGKTGELLFQRDGQPGYLLGIGIESAGDVDGDGRPEQLAGASGAKGTGAAFLYSGADGALVRELWGEGQGDQFGRKVAGAGDQDGDGIADQIIGAPGHDGAGTDAGRAYVFSGADGSVIATLDGEAAGDNFGSCVDGYSDGETRLLIIGAQHAGPGDRGYVAVYRMAAEGPELAFRIESQPGDVNLGRMFVSAVGDVNGDGVVDVYGSDWESNANGLSGSGRIYVHSGADGSRLHTFSGEAAGDGYGHRHGRGRRRGRRRLRRPPRRRLAERRRGARRRPVLSLFGQVRGAAPDLHLLDVRRHLRVRHHRARGRERRRDPGLPDHLRRQPGAGAPVGADLRRLRSRSRVARIVRGRRLEGAAPQRVRYCRGRTGGRRGDRWRCDRPGLRQRAARRGEERRPPRAGPGRERCLARELRARHAQPRAAPQPAGDPATAPLLDRARGLTGLRPSAHRPGHGRGGDGASPGAAAASGCSGRCGGARRCSRARATSSSSWSAATDWTASGTSGGSSRCSRPPRPSREPRPRTRSCASTACGSTHSPRPISWSANPP